MLTKKFTLIHISWHKEPSSWKWCVPCQEIHDLVPQMNFHHLSTQSHLRTAQIQLKQFHPQHLSEEIHANQVSSKIRAKRHNMEELLDYLNLHLQRDFQPKIELGPCLLLNPKV